MTLLLLDTWFDNDKNKNSSLTKSLEHELSGQQLTSVVMVLFVSGEISRCLNSKLMVYLGLFRPNNFVDYSIAELFAPLNSLSFFSKKRSVYYLLM